MLRRPSSSLSLVRPSVPRVVSSHALDAAVRRLSSSPVRSLRNRIVPEREKFPKRERHDPLTVRQIEDIAITDELTATAGTTTKERITYGINRQTKYFTEEVFRMDKEEATKAVLEGLPPLTEVDIDDFYLNLMASGNELGNLPALASPNRTAADADARKRNELAFESEEQQTKRLAAEAATRAAREKMRARQQALLDALRVDEQSSSGRLSAGDPANAIDGPAVQAEQEHEQAQEQVVVEVASNQQRPAASRRLRMNSAGMIEEDTSNETLSSSTRSNRNQPDAQIDRPQSEEAQASTSSSFPSAGNVSSPTSAPSGQTFEERYPHAIRLTSTTSTPSDPRPSLSASLVPEPAPAGADSHVSTEATPVDPSTTLSKRSRFASRLQKATVSPPAPSSISASTSTPPTPAIPSPPFTESRPSDEPTAFFFEPSVPPHMLPSSSSSLPSFSPAGMDVSRTRKSSPVRPISPPSNPLIVQLEVAISQAEASRATSPSVEPSYLDLPPAPDMGPPSPIQPPPRPTDSKGRPRPAAVFPTGFPMTADSAPPNAVYNQDGKVKMPVPALSDAPRAPHRPSMLPMGLMTHGEWKAVIYQSLEQPAKLKLAREREIGERIAGRPHLIARERAKRLKEKLRKEQNDDLGKLVKSGGEKADAMVQAGYALQAAKVMELMHRSGDRPSRSWFLDVLKSLAQCGDVRGVEQVIAQAERAGHPVSYETYSYLVDAHLGNDDVHNAVATLHDLESRDLYPVEASYRALIRTLVNSDVHSERAVGWDLVAHMRLVAHPIPKKETYDVIIAACANHILPEPERALDLWTEMTIDNSVQPDVRSFNAIIKAVGSARKFYLEGFRLMRQMLDFYHTAIPDSAQRAMYTPDRQTFENLLVGAKKAGDIARTRWILTEMIRFSNHPGLANDGAAISPTALTMKSVFQAYTAAKPNIDREWLKHQDRVNAPVEGDHRIRQVTDGHQDGDQVASQTGQEDEIAEEEEDADDFDASGVTVEYGNAAEAREGETDEMDDEDAEWGTMDSQSFQHSLDQSPILDSSSARTGGSTSAPESDEPSEPASASTGPNVQQAPLPQSSSEIMHEARRLLSHATDDATIFLNDRTQRTPAGNLPSLRHVIVDTPLVNAYMSVLYAHSEDLDVGIEAFRTTYDEHNVRKDARSYLAMFDYLKRRGRHQREQAADEIFKLFQEWEAFEKSQEEYLQHRLEGGASEREVWAMRRAIGLEPRIAQNIWVFAIEVMTLAGQLSIAMSMVKQFAKVYPPEKILESAAPSLPSKALIRMVPRSSIRPDPLPPHLLFVDLQLLHTANAHLQQEKPLAYIKWLTSRYAECINEIRRHKLNEGEEGQMRLAENELDKSLRKTSIEVSKKTGKYAKDHSKKFGGGLNRFEGGYGLRPDDVKMGKVEAKIFRIHGGEALDRYLRAKRQF